MQILKNDNKKRTVQTKNNKKKTNINNQKAGKTNKNINIYT